MAAIDRIRAKYLEQHPMRDEAHAVAPDWVNATAAVLDEIIAENRRAAGKHNPDEA